MIRRFYSFFHREKEVKRQLAHMAFGFAYVLAYFLGLMPLWLAWGLVASTLLASLLLKERSRFIDRFIHLFQRKQELMHLPLGGMIYYFLGAALTITLFEPVPAMAGILILAIADSIGTLYGKYLGMVKIPWNKDKHMEGPLLGGFFSALVCMTFVPIFPAILGAYFGAFIDTLDWGIDDNLLIPVFSAGLIQFLL